ncbi:DUF393 domain-containing protein [Alicyclobacillus cycloheptanicus]|uniref:DCC family thiol-disulfide oxidoreductase YuxK n=1 Tax=Alicyclobacillus cycloheptanicus TaxID=1457 RepID=A0ABT9XF01_9BACL|nr:DUF393 domain-containing protein [Alicyclobacillus cycloheptanicus]MDQ0188777.1 putative DCC family thiol-disulfide oxidoreductase YuxK [Alicyclobacillus cycloheptanicus]WDM00566.1 DUF393 domain-containing protein [Alicyclobacillus cycloheptanicus]
MRQIVLFDGVCNLCSAAVQWIIRRDRTGQFRFASLQSNLARELGFGPSSKAPDPESLVYLRGSRSFTRSTAALYIAKDLGGWTQLAFAFILIPRPLRDLLYDVVARRRYQWFGKRATCWMPTPQLQARFLDQGEAAPQAHPRT